MTILDQIEQAWTDFLGFMSMLVIPDWQVLISLLPVFMLIGFVGPLLTLAVLSWLGYGIVKPRVQVKYDYGTQVAPLDHLGEPIFPSGEPYCSTDGLIYPSGTLRCDRDRAPLSVRCPKCEIVRDAGIQTCGNCGLVLKIEPRALVIAGDRPPPGGAALA